MTTTTKDRRRLMLIIAAALVVLAMIVLLRAEGRSFLCSCGHFAVWVSDWCSSNTSQQLLDPYSFTHVLHGFLFFWLIALVFKRMPRGWQFLLAMMLESAWEVFENTSFVINKYRTETAALGYTGDTVVNSLGDLACALIGFVIARQLGVRRSLIVFVLVEAILIFLIHDSLLLQILMLVRPVEAIKFWQMCQ
ncbi:MAG TPA: DUF2585 family protein [Pyrinomonadaceae bacterium]|nr:DUF2585 family protein [Pyrinomonadaceae bacterium]